MDANQQHGCIHFDNGILVIVPKGGQMVTHFISQSYESATVYHNRPFDTTSLLHEFIFARFVWAVINRARAIFQDASLADKTTFRLKATDAAPTDEEEVSDKEHGGDESIEPQQTSGVPKQKQSQRKERVDDPTFEDPAAREARELAEDIATAKKVTPFFLEPEGIANAYTYENMTWYPESGIIERRKQGYLDAHPNIRAYSEACAASSSSDTDQISEGGID